MTTLKPGDKAPDFRLFSSDKKEVKLEDFKGKNVVLLFFPLAFTSTCTAELCGVRDDISNYNSLNATVLGISVDTPHSLAIFKKQENYNFDLLSDFNKEASTAYGSIYDSFTPMGMKGVSKRASFVIDRQGVIRYSQILENAGEFPDFGAIQSTLGTIA